MVNPTPRPDLAGSDDPPASSPIPSKTGPRSTGTAVPSLNHHAVPDELLDELAKALAQRLTALVKGLGKTR